MEQYEDELYHYGRKGMKKGMNIFNPDYKPVGQKAGTENAMQRQPVKSTKRKRLASMKAERATFKTFQLTPEKYNRFINIAKKEANSNLKIRGVTGRQERSEKINSQKRAKNINRTVSSVDSDTTRYEKNKNRLSKGSKRSVVDRHSDYRYEPGVDAGNKKAGSLENPLAANANYKKSRRGYAVKSAEESDKRYGEKLKKKYKEEAVKNKGNNKIGNPLLDRQNKVSKMKADVSGNEALKKRKVKQSRKKKQIREKSSRQAWQH